MGKICISQLSYWDFEGYIYQWEIIEPKYDGQVYFSQNHHLIKAQL